MNELKNLTELLLNVYKNSPKKNNVCNYVPIGVSNRHIHLSKEHLSILFGEGYQLTNIKNLSQPGQFACGETLTLIGKKGIIENVRVLGPERPQTQVELFMTDCIKLGLKAEIRMSGDLEDTSGLTLVGPKGCVQINNGVIVAQRHIHMSDKQARDFNLRNGQVVHLEFDGIRGGILKNVIVRADSKSQLDCHIDMEEANALGIKNGQMAKIIY